LDKDGALGFVQLSDHGIGASTMWGEIDFYGGWFFLGKSNGWRERYPKTTCTDRKKDSYPFHKVLSLQLFLLIFSWGLTNFAGNIPRFHSLFSSLKCHQIIR
jgi:hypothetical protein